MLVSLIKVRNQICLMLWFWTKWIEIFDFICSLEKGEIRRENGLEDKCIKVAFMMHALQLCV